MFLVTTAPALTARPIVYVVPCGAAKLDHAAPARELYTGSHFRNTLAAAEQLAAEEDGTVLILSALYGLVELDTVLEPYDVRMTDADSITAQDLRNGAVELGLDELDPELYAMLPAAYYDRLAEALAPLYVFPADVFEAAPGIGYQRGAIRCARDLAA